MITIAAIMPIKIFLFFSTKAVVLSTVVVLNSCVVSCLAILFLFYIILVCAIQNTKLVKVSCILKCFALNFHLQRFLFV